MTEFLTGTDLASFLGVDETNAIDSIVDRTNALVLEEWASPVFPIPQWVTNIAWDVAVRAGSNPGGKTSTTRAWDDITVTDRWEAGAPTGVALTPEEALRLNSATTSGDTLPTPVAPKSIQMVVPGWTRPQGWPGWRGDSRC